MGKPFAEKYDHQFILYFAGTDKAAENNAESLVVRAAGAGVLKQTTVIELEEPQSSSTYDLSDCKPLAKGRVHVYVVGHGTDTSDSVGGCTAKDLAKTIDTMSEKKITRVSIVACHAGGDGNTGAPHRFVGDFWDQAKGSIEEVSGYTGTVRTGLTTFQTKFDSSGSPVGLPQTAHRYKSWSGEEWWVKRGSVKKQVGHQHDEGGNVRKVYYSSKGGFTTKGWTGKNM
jgi:hypothetical protein